MELFLKNLANLVKVKTIVTLVIIVIYAVLALKGTLSADIVNAITMAVIGFYFGTVHEKKEG